MLAINTEPPRFPARYFSIGTVNIPEVQLKNRSEVVQKCLLALANFHERILRFFSTLLLYELLKRR